MFMKSLICSSLALSVFMAMPEVGSSRNLDTNTKWDKVFDKSDKVDVKKVKFKNRYGIELVGDLYIPKNKSEGKLPAIAVSGPFGAVKEQSSGLYAQTMAENGYITLAFDASYTGESGGEPRNVASPDINTEDFSGAVDYLSTLPEVDENKIGLIGICGFGGFALNDASMDTRVKAVVTSTMYDMSRVNANGYFDSMKEEDRYKLKEQLNKQRTADAKSGKYLIAQGLPDKLTGKEPQYVQDYFNYYKTERGFHPRSINSNGGWNTTSSLSFIILSTISSTDGGLPTGLFMSSTGTFPFTASLISLIICPILISTEINFLAVFASSEILFEGNGNNVIGLRIPTFNPSFLHSFIADFAFLAGEPKLTSIISASSVLISSHWVSLCSIILYFA